MATEKVEVIEGDGSSDKITVTDDPVEDATVQAVKNAIGDESTASEQADSTVAATLLERVTALVDALTSGQASDEVRVALATDLLSGNVDVDLAAQSTGNVSVELAADSLTGNLDVDLAAQTSGALDVSGATVPTEQQTPVQLEDSTGTNIDPATEQKLENVRALVDKLDDGLESVGSDEHRVNLKNGASPVAFPDVGRQTVSTSGSPEALVSGSAPVASGVRVKALPSNGNTAYAWITGGSKSESFVLAAGDEVFIPVDDASKVIVDVDTGGDSVSYVAA